MKNVSYCNFISVNFTRHAIQSDPSNRLWNAIWTFQFMFNLFGMQFGCTGMLIIATITKSTV